MKVVYCHNDVLNSVLAQNTDRELWREQPGNYYSASIHVTAMNKIGINVGGHVIVMSIQQWFSLAESVASINPDIVVKSDHVDEANLPH